MSEFLQSDEEQRAALIKWWNESGRPLLAGLIIAGLVVAGWRWWLHDRELHRQDASDVFQSLVADMIAEPDLTEIDLTKAQQLVDQYADTAYGDFGQLILARKAAEIGNFPAAVEQLQAVLARKPEEPIASLARYRLARAYKGGGQYDEALATLAQPMGESFAVLVDALRGDIYMQKGDWSAAVQAYERAVAGADAVGMNGDLLNMKLVEARGKAGTS